jgi:hypothetical protein
MSGVGLAWQVLTGTQTERSLFFILQFITGAREIASGLDSAAALNVGLGQTFSVILSFSLQDLAVQTEHI